MEREHQGTPFITSSHSDHECVAVAPAQTVAVIDSKDADGSALEFDRAEWGCFLAMVKDA